MNVYHNHPVNLYIDNVETNLTEKVKDIKNVLDNKIK